MKQRYIHQPKSLKSSTLGWKAQTSALILASRRGVTESYAHSEFGRPQPRVHITQQPHVTQHNFSQLVVSLQERPEADAADRSLERAVRLGRLEITGRSVRLSVCACVWRAGMGRAHNTASLQYSQLLHKEKISEIHAIMQDKQTSSSCCLKIWCRIKQRR